MISNGANTQYFSHERDLEQLNILSASLSDLEIGFKKKQLTIPGELIALGLNHQTDMALLYENIIAQSYKFQHATPGELIKLTSMVAATFGISVYATRDIHGHFQIILDKNANRIQIQSLPIEKWDHQKALFNRLQYFENQPPEHLLPFFAQNAHQYYHAIQQQQNLLEGMYLGECIEIPTLSVPDQQFPMKVIKTGSSEFAVLLETSNPDEPFIRLDSSKKSIWRNHEGVMLDEHSISFLASIDKAIEKLNSNGLPPQLAGLINLNDLQTIYNYIAKHPQILTKLNSGQSFRLPKELSRLARTINVIREPSGEIMLMLETKRKLAAGIKDPARIIGKGTFGTVKPSWRIDTLVPEEWVNKVMKHSYAKEADYEALFSQSLLQSRDDPSKDVLNVSILGELFTSKGVVKRSQYSRRAIGDLLSVMSNPNITLTPEDKMRITQNILDGLAVMHKEGKIHQDLKLPNIFIYQDADGYYAKIADFGISYDPTLPTNKPSLASGGYESPEIMTANESPTARYHKYYYTDNFIKKFSYAYKIHMNNPTRSPESPEALEFRKPHAANDMWALGIVLFELEHGAMPRFGFSVDEQRIEQNALLKGILNPNRNERMNIQQALEQHRLRTQHIPTKPASREPALTFAQTSQPQDAPSVAAEPSKRVITYNPIIGVQYLSLGQITGPNGRIKRDIFVNTLKKAYDNDQKLFNLILESQTLRDLERLRQSLVKYLDNSNALIYPELIQAVDIKANQKVESIAIGASDDELAQQGKADVEQYTKDKTGNTSGFKF